MLSDIRIRGGGVRIFAVKGRITSKGAGSFREEMLKNIEGDGKRVLFDLEGVTAVDGNFAGALITLARRIKEGGGEMKIFGPQERVADFLTGYSELLSEVEVCDTEDAAVRRFK